MECNQLNGNDGEVTYKMNDIRYALQLLDEISVKGIYNAERIVAIGGILGNGRTMRPESEQTGNVKTKPDRKRRKRGRRHGNQ